MSVASARINPLNPSLLAPSLLTVLIKNYWYCYTGRIYFSLSSSECSEAGAVVLIFFRHHHLLLLLSSHFFPFFFSVPLNLTHSIPVTALRSTYTEAKDMMRLKTPDRQKHHFCHIKKRFGFPEKKNNSFHFIFITSKSRK